MTTLSIDIECEFEGATEEDEGFTSEATVEVEFSIHGGYSPQTWESPAEYPEVEFMSAYVREFGRWYKVTEDELDEFVDWSDLHEQVLESAADDCCEPDEPDVDYDYAGDCGWEP
jgi:hypothetical protein